MGVSKWKISANGKESPKIESLFTKNQSYALKSSTGFTHMRCTHAHAHTHTRTHTHTHTHVTKTAYHIVCTYMSGLPTLTD